MPTTDFLTPDFYEFLSGKIFSHGQEFKYKPSRIIMDRVSLMRKLCNNKSVLHVGCCDHVVLVEQKVREGRWLHGVLSDTSSICLGIDIDENSIEVVKKATGFKNVIHGDVTKPGLAEIARRHWDIAVFGEVLEHIGDPVRFLKGFSENYGGVVPKILVTVPNSTSIRNIVNVLKGKEVINTDHRLMFSPFTLSKVIWEAGYRVVELGTYLTESENLVKGMLKRRLMRTFPLAGDGLWAIAVQKVEKDGEEVSEN